MCTHPYRKPMGLLWWCFTCKQYFMPENKMAKTQAAPITLPPVIFGITEALWKNIRPWPLFPFKLVKKYGWYISMLHGQQYLIMPIVRDREAVFYSARLLDKGVNAPKYDYPKGAKKVLWISSERLPSPVFLGEGVADAAYLSQLGSGVALLGNYYDGSLDDKLKGKQVIVALDGDAVGITSAVRIAVRFGLERTRVLTLPSGTDPTDWELPEIRVMIDRLGV